MRKLTDEVKKELREVEEQGINMNNLDTTFKLVDILKDLKKIEKMEGEEMNEYNIRGRYRDGGDYGDGNYGRRGVPGSGRGRYSDGDGRMREHLDRIMDGMEMYEYGRERSRYGHGDDERLYDGLEKLMYAICMFVESTMEFADTPQEKEIIRKHVQKMARI